MGFSTMPKSDAFGFSTVPKSHAPREPPRAVRTQPKTAQSRPELPELPEPAQSQQSQPRAAQRAHSRPEPPRATQSHRSRILHISSNSVVNPVGRQLLALHKAIAERLHLLHPGPGQPMCIILSISGYIEMGAGCCEMLPAKLLRSSSDVVARKL